MAEEDTTHPLPPSRAPMLAGNRALAIIPTTLEEVFRLATAVIRSGMAPHGINTQEQATIIILHGLEVGLSPMNALQSIALINGKPALYGDGALGVVRNSGLMEKIVEKINDADGDNMSASCTVKRRGEPSITRVFSKKDAVVANLWGKRTKQGEPTPWVTYPKRMLAMRARAWALRDGFADVLRGLAIREEMEDIDTTPARRGPPPPPPVEQRTPLEQAISEADAADTKHAAQMADLEPEAERIEAEGRTEHKVTW